jgi:hypothetical protein
MKNVNDSNANAAANSRTVRFRYMPGFLWEMSAGAHELRGRPAAVVFWTPM